MRRVAGMLLGQLMAAGFYLLLIDTVQLPELYAGLGVVALAWCAYEAARRQRLAEAWISPAWLMRAGRVLASLPLQSAIVAWEAVRQLFSPSPARGTLRAVSFAARGERPADVGRRALAEGLGSLAPNTIVIGVDRERELLLVHQLRRRGGREQVDVLGLG